MVKRLPLTFAALSTVVLSIPALAATHSHHASAKSHVTASHAVSKHAVRAHAAAAHGRHGARAVAVRHEPAPAMDAGRATAIQTALIRAGYLSGEPSGLWDAGSVAAMQKLQDDNGWQTKYTPDSRALVKLGLGAVPLPPTPPTGTPVVAEQASIAQP